MTTYASRGAQSDDGGGEASSTAPVSDSGGESEPKEGEYY